MLRRSLAVALPLLLLACGIQLVGEPEGHDDTGRDAGTPSLPPTGSDPDADVVAPDAAPNPDGGGDAALPGTDGGVDLPIVDAGPPVIYALSYRLWRFNPVSSSWSGGNADLDDTSCGRLDDLALDGDARLFGVGGGGTSLHRVSPVPVGCTKIGDLDKPTTALGFAPRGTLEPAADVLVGFSTAGDYVRVDTTNAAVTVVKPDALGGRVAGDLTNIGAQGYVVLSGSGCVGSCLHRFDLKTGALEAGAVGVVAPPPLNAVSGLAHWGGDMWAFISPTTVLRVGLGPGGLATMPVLNLPGIDVRYQGAASSPHAPTK